MLIDRAAPLFGRLRLDDLLNTLLEWPKTGRRFQVLNYHKVSPDPHPSFPPIMPRVFEQQILFLKRHYQILDLEDLIQSSYDGTIPPKAVAITFDDGYRDNFEYAFPLLQKHNVTATIFLTTSALDNREKIWHDRIFDSFRFSRSSNHKWVLHDVIARAKTLSGSERIPFIEEIERDLDPEIPDEFQNPMLSWSQVIEMHRAGIRFGSHTCTHPILSREDPVVVWDELVQSKGEIEEHLQARISLLAYPNGQSNDFTPEVQQAVEKAGYSAAFSTVLGSNRCVDNPYAMKRGQPWQTDASLFRFRFFIQRHVTSS